MYKRVVAFLRHTGLHIASFLRRNGLNIALVMVALAIGLCTYTIIHDQDVRAQAILRECRNQNARHAATISTLRRNAHDALAPDALARTEQLLSTIGIHASTAAIRRFEILSTQNDTQTIKLINSLAPQRNCSHVLANATSTH